MPDNRLLLPYDTDLVYVDDPNRTEPHPLRGKITQWWADALSALVSDSAVAFSFVNLLDFAPSVSVRDLLGDGMSHPLSQFYPTIGLARVKYPFATTLTMQTAAAALQLGINTLQDVGGGVMFIPGGTYMIHDVTLRQKVWLWGAGYGNVIFKMPDGKNSFMLKSDGFDSLYATIATHTDPVAPMPGSPEDLTMGIWAFGLDGISLNGNRANNASGDGLLIYGYNFVLRHLRVYGFSGSGVVTSWSNAANFPDWTDAMEGHFYDIKVHDNEGKGWMFNGPHDSRSQMCEVYENGTIGFHLGRNGAAYFDGLHSYGPTQLIAARFDELAHLNDCVFETAQGAQLVANNGLLGYCKVFSVESIAGSIGMVIGSVLDPVAKTVSNITGGSGIVLTVTFTAPHLLFTGDQIALSGVVGIAAANYSPWVVTKINSTQISLQFSQAATGAYVSGGSALLMGIPNGMNLLINASNCATGLFDTTYAYGSGNTLTSRGFFTPEFTNPLVFVGGTNASLYQAALARLDGWDYNVWINSDSTLPLGNLHAQNTTGVYARRIDIEGPESTEIGLHLRGTEDASPTSPRFAFTRNANNTSAQIYTDDGANLDNFYEADYSAFQNILYQDTLIKNLKKLIYESTGASIHANGPDPEGSVTAPPGSLYLRSTGALYLKESGTGNTGWVELSPVLVATLGDLLVGGSSGRFVNLAIGSTGQFLRVTGGTAVWATLGAADMPSSIDPLRLSPGTVDATELGYLNGVTSAIQTQLNAKAPSSGISATAISGGTVSNPEFDRLSGVSSNLQAQLDALEARINSLESIFTSAISGTAQLAKLTGGGSNGAADFNGGVLVALINPT